MFKGINYTIMLCLLLASNSAISTEVLFSCKTQKNKTVLITKKDKVITYTYGKKEKPELKLTRQISDIKIQLGQGSAGAFYDSITFSNGDYEYSISASSQINNLELNNFASIDVFNKNKKITEIKCTPQTVANNLEKIEL